VGDYQEIIHRLIAGRSPSSVKVLDIGCGNGHLLITCA